MRQDGLQYVIVGKQAIPLCAMGLIPNPKSQPSALSTITDANGCLLFTQ